MRAAGVRLINGVVESLQLPGPRELRADEILIEVRAAGAGRLATITADLPVAGRDITMTAIQVVPDGARLGKLAQLAAQGALSIASIRSYPLAQAAEALALASHGAAHAALVLHTSGDKSET